MSNATLGKPTIKARILVRDKDGHPKFDDPEKIRQHLADLTKEDIDYLRTKYDDFYFSDRS